MNQAITLIRETRNKRLSFVVRWYGEPNQTGRQRRYSKTFKLKMDAEKFRAEKMVAFSKGTRRDKPQEQTLKDFCNRWLDIRKGELRPGTIQLYGYTIKYLLRHFGPNCQLSRIRPLAAQEFIATLQPLVKDTLSNWTKHRILRNSKTIFENAVTWELIPSNPFKKVKAPKCINKPWYYLTPPEYKRLLTAAPTLRWKALYALAYTAGLRFGELFSLMWDNVDFQAGEVKVQNRPATTTLPPFYIKDSQAREIPVPGSTLAIVADLKTYNEVTDETPYVLLNHDQFKSLKAKWQKFHKQGRPWENQDIVNNVLREFRKHLKGADIKTDKQLTIHTLRKCCITNWARTTNNPEAVRKWAGHADLKTTMEYYSQTTEADKEQVRIQIENLVKT